MSNVKNTDEILAALLGAETTHEKDVFMPRFGVNFRIKSISVKERADARAKAMKTEFDDQLFKTIVIQKGTITPDFTDQKLRDKYGPTTYDVIENLLTVDEYDTLLLEILTLSSGGVTVDDVKN